VLACFPSTLSRSASDMPAGVGGRQPPSEGARFVAYSWNVESGQK